MGDETEEQRLRGTALKNAESILIARQDAERKLIATKDALEHLAAVVTSSDDAIITKTLEGVIATWNPGAERMFGYSADEVIGKSVTLLIPPDHVDEEPLILERLKRGERIDHYETKRLRKDGTLLDVSLSVSPIKGCDGTTTGASKIARDITRQKRADAALLEETRALELLNATGTSIAAQLDLQALMQTVTDSATQLSGARFGAFLYQRKQSSVLFTLSGVSRTGFCNANVFDTTTQRERVLRSGDITKAPPDGALSPRHPFTQANLPVSSYLSVPVISRTGEVVGSIHLGHPDTDVFTERAERLVIGVAAQAGVAIDNARLYEAAQREIASRERAEAALRDIDRRKDEFLATLAHELRNPLAPIRQAALISKTPAATEAQKRWSHDVINRQVHHMALLLDDLLDISRITRGTLQLRMESTDLAAVVDAAVETARPAIDAKRHEFTVDVPSEAVHFAADPLRLAQVLSNLLTNAAKYTDPGGLIRLRARRAGETIEISVTDTGIGIAPDALATVFEMFSQVTSGKDRSEGGLGIGLALAKGFVDLHDGTIEVESKGAGRGSEFTVRLPLRMLSAPQEHSRGSEEKPFVSRRVLIADDNRDAADSLAMLMEAEGHEVTVVHDGREAIAAFSAVQPEVALLDIGMPELNGYEVARQVRRGTLGRAVTLIAVTGWGQDNDKARALAAGFNHHFTKPVRPELLSELIRSQGQRG